MLEVKVTYSKELQEARNVLAEIFARNNSAMVEGLRTLNAFAAHEIRQQIVQGKQGPALAHGSKLKRSIGKTKGAVWPPIPKYSSVKPLNRSSLYASSIQELKIGPLAYSTSVKDIPGRFSGGPIISVRRVAWEQEFPTTKVLVMTHRMRAYLLILYGVIRGPFKRHAKPGYVKNKVLQINVPPRPVWKTVWNRELNNFPRIFLSAWAVHLRLKDLTGPI